MLHAVRFGNRRVYFGVTFFFLLGGLGLVVVGSMDPVTGFLDENATEDSDPAGDVLPLIGWIWAGVALLMLVIGGLITRAGSRDDALMRRGTPAPARIDAVETTGVTMNEVNTGIRVAVTVMPPGEPEFAAVIKAYVPPATIPLAGEVALVAFDPRDRTRVTFVSDPRNSIGGGKTPVAPDGRPLWQARGGRGAPS